MMSTFALQTLEQNCLQVARSDVGRFQGVGARRPSQTFWSRRGNQCCGLTSLVADRFCRELATLHGRWCWSMSQAKVATIAAGMAVFTPRRAAGGSREFGRSRRNARQKDFRRTSLAQTRRALQRHSVFSKQSLARRGLPRQILRVVLLALCLTQAWLYNRQLGKMRPWTQKLEAQFAQPMARQTLREANARG